jgi:UDP-N-acetylglucosamine 2-epimerase (non-hydrolysing)
MIGLLKSLNGMILINMTEAAGTVVLVGTNTKKIISEAHKLLNDTLAYEKMSKKHNPYGDGRASLKIINHIISCI